LPPAHRITPIETGGWVQQFPWLPEALVDLGGQLVGPQTYIDVYLVGAGLPCRF
jgi:hypothetical protein